jgi:hypothetical protein
MQQIGFFIAKLIVRSACFGHHYAHHQDLKIYTDEQSLHNRQFNQPSSQADQAHNQ